MRDLACGTRPCRIRRTDEGHWDPCIYEDIHVCMMANIIVCHEMSGNGRQRSDLPYTMPGADGWEPAGPVYASAVIRSHRRLRTVTDRRERKEALTRTVPPQVSTPRGREGFSSGIPSLSRRRRPWLHPAHHRPTHRRHMGAGGRTRCTSIERSGRPPPCRPVNAGGGVVGPGDSEFPRNGLAPVME